MKCKKCNKDFSPKVSHQKYCGEKCRMSFWSHKYYHKNKEKILKKQRTKKYRLKESR